MATAVTTRRARASASALPVLRSRFGRREAERLLWRAGFGPRPGEADRLARLGLEGAVRSLTRPRGQARLVGPRPRDDRGRPLAPSDAWSHDHLWWLDRMVRSSQPLVERMALIWHDWFATSIDAAPARLLLDQNATMRRRALGSFHTLLLDVTKDPAMLLFLSGTSNNKWSPNENYARELMELFTLGAGRGYTERDVREQARALTGWRNEWSDGIGPHRFRFDRTHFDAGTKRVFGKRGAFDWRDACRLCVEHRLHPSFFVRKLWSYFIPTPPSRRDQAALERLYKRQRYAIRPVVEAILRHPKLYGSTRLVTPPVVYNAGLLRMVGRGVDTESWGWLSGLAGQRLFLPPNVAGWDDDAWLDTATWRGRWMTANEVVEGREVDPEHADRYGGRTETPEQAVTKALAFWGNPSVGSRTRAALLAFARRCEAGANADWQRETYPVLRQNALRMLIATSPDLMTS